MRWACLFPHRSLPVFCQANTYRYVRAFPLPSMRWSTSKSRRRRDGLQPADKAGQDDLGGRGQTGMYGERTATILQRLLNVQLVCTCSSSNVHSATTLVKTSCNNTRAAVTGCCWLDACVRACDALVVQDACVLGTAFWPPRPSRAQVELAHKQSPFNKSLGAKGGKASTCASEGSDQGGSGAKAGSASSARRTTRGGKAKGGGGSAHRLRCGDCGEVLVGSADVAQHAKATGHTSYAEVA